MAKKIIVEKDEELWKDRKRFLGMPLSFTRYILTKDRLTLKIGFFNTVTDETMLYRIMDIRLSRKLRQKLFGVGTVTLITADKSDPTITLKNVKQSDDVRKLVSQHVDCQRSARGIRGSEFLGGLGHDDCGHVPVESV